MLVGLTLSVITIGCKIFSTFAEKMNMPEIANLIKILSFGGFASVSVPIITKLLV